ncbi:MAG: YggT family protein [Eubacteriales bacterium]
MSIFIRAVNTLFNLIEILILARIILSYLRNIVSPKIYNILFQLTEPILYPIRELLYKIGLNKGMIDFSPIVAFLLMNVLRTVLINLFI